MGEYISVDVLVLYVYGFLGKPMAEIKTLLGKEELGKSAVGVGVIAFAFSYVLAYMGLRHKIPELNLDDVFGVVVFIAGLLIVQTIVAAVLGQVLKLPVDVRRLVLCNTIYWLPWLPAVAASFAFLPIGPGFLLSLVLYLFAVGRYGHRLGDDPAGISRGRCHCCSTLSCFLGTFVALLVLLNGTRPGGGSEKHEAKHSAADVAAPTEHRPESR